MVESNKEDQIFELKDGRKLGYAEYGDLNGKPIFHFHGHPGSRLEGRLFGEKPKKHGVHAITVDRPGIGLSDFKPNRKLLDWPDDIIELADHLGLNKFAVQGISGGGPYVASCAFKIPERLTCCGIIAGLGPINWSKKGMMLSNRITVFVSRRLPFLVKTIVKAEKKAFEDQKSLEELANNLPEPDKILFQDPQIVKIMIEDSKEAFRNGLDGAILEEKIFARLWGFDLKDIPSNLQVYIWHGEMDVFVPPSMGRKMSELIPNCKGYFLPNEGHLSVGFNHLDEILETLAS
ncbi:MAG: alpha/beta hydrolase [Candidatus Lokiarchaeota archaeon]|nr:alpha/beta hydrolase [Candidatus Lokiarchaeota archaeon]